MKKNQIARNLILLAVTGLLAYSASADPVAAPKTPSVPTTAPALVAPSTQPIDPAVAALVKQLGDDDSRKRDQAASQLRTLGEKALPALAQGLNHNDAQIRISAEDLMNDIRNPKKPEPKPEVANNGAIDGNAVVIGPNGQLFINGGMINGPFNGQIKINQGQLNIGGGMQIQVQTRIMNGVKTQTREVTSNANGRKVHIRQDNGAIKMEITDGDKTESYEAKTEAELKEKQPEAFKVFKQFIND